MIWRFGRASDDKKIDIEGRYLFPFSWLVYGVSHGYISFNETKWNQSLQRNILKEMEDNQEAMEFISKHGDQQDLWVYSGKSLDTWALVSISSRDVESDRFKGGSLKIRSVADILQATENEQKTVNNSIIQCFRGCGVNLDSRVWKRGELKIFSNSYNAKVVSEEEANEEDVLDMIHKILR